MNFKIDTIKSKLSELATLHQAISDDSDDFKDAELIELEAEQLIVVYCEEKGYLIDGFPTAKKLLPVEELEEDYFCRERYQLYVDILATQKEDVAELMWYYVSNFWADQYESKAEYIQNLKDNLDSGVFYDVTI
jgi:hypothetical protein